MIQHEMTAQDLTDSILLDLVAQTDPVGVISIYVDCEAATRSCATATEVRKKLAELLHNLDASGSGGDARAVRAAIQRGASAIERLIDGRAPGRGRALFIACDAPRVTSYSGQLPMVTRVVLDTSPFVHPLLETREAGRPAGVALVGDTAVELLDWRLGHVRRVARMKPEARTSVRFMGQVFASPSRSHRPGTAREQRSSCERDRQVCWLHGLAPEVFRCYEERGWQRLVVLGDERLTTPLVDALPGWMSEVTYVDRRQVSTATPSELHAIIRHRLAEEQTHRQVALVERLRDAASSEGRAVLGLSEVTAALDQARVEHLVYDPATQHAGSAGTDGWLSLRREGIGTLVEDQRLTEHLVERCLAIGAEITPVLGPAAERLEDADGVGALLHW